MSRDESGFSSDVTPEITVDYFEAISSHNRGSLLLACALSDPVLFPHEQGPTPTQVVEAQLRKSSSRSADVDTDEYILQQYMCRAVKRILVGTVLDQTIAVEAVGSLTEEAIKAIASIENRRRISSLQRQGLQNQLQAIKRSTDHSTAERAQQALQCIPESQLSKYVLFVAKGFAPLSPFTYRH